MVLIHRKPSSHAGPRPEEETPHRLARTKSKLKVRAEERRQQVQVFLENIAAVFLVVALCAFLFTITSKSAVHSEKDNRSVTLVEAEDNYVQEPLPTSYQCALVWVRIPKTASTTIIRRFMTPFVWAADFTNTDIQPNTCVTDVGGCADIWQKRKLQAANDTNEDSIDTAPPQDGISSHIYSGSNSQRRCLPSTSYDEEDDDEFNTQCWEYDRSLSTLTRFDSVTRVERFDAHPSLHTHVALDPTLFGWLLPRSPMVFSTFRDPVDRLLSSFHFGMRIGGDRQVAMCSLPGVDTTRHQWQSRVIAAREAVKLENNNTLYQQALREYLDSCRDVVSNVYVQFLDPDTKNVNVALQHLEKYVIVGLQDDLDKSLQRWAKIAVWSCRDHPNISRIRKDLLTEPKHVGARFRQSATLLASNEGDENGAATGTAELASPTLEELDEDLQQLIRTLTVDDETIFQRAKELYEEQGRWFELAKDVGDNR